MKLPNEIGPIHFVGIGGIGMSGIAEVLINLGHAVQGSDASDNANVKRLREHGAKVFVGHDAANLGDAAVVVVSTAIKRDNPELVSAARETHSGRPARRDAGRADAPQKLRRGRRHPRQDHHHRAGGDAARGGRARPDRDQRRHHQRLRRQRPPRRRRLDGGRGRRERRHLPQAAGGRGDRHQHRPRAPRPFQDLRRDQGGLSGADRKPAVLRLRRDVPRPSDGAGVGRADRGPARLHLRREPAGRRPPARRRDERRRHPLRCADLRAGDRPCDLYRQSGAADARASQRPQRHRGNCGCA